MLEKIKSKLLEFYNKEDKIWLFFSIFDKNNKLLISNWVLTTDKPIVELIEILYHAILEKQTWAHTIAIDIIKEIKQEPDIQKILSLNTKDYWIFAMNKENNTSWVILPNTAWINDSKTALWVLKEKYKLSWNVEVYSFTSRRIAFEI